MLKIKDNDTLQKMVEDYDLEKRKDIITNEDRYYSICALEIDTWNENCIGPYHAGFSSCDLDIIHIWTKEGLLEHVED